MPLVMPPWWAVLAEMSLYRCNARFPVIPLCFLFWSGEDLCWQDNALATLSVVFSGVERWEGFLPDLYRTDCMLPIRTDLSKISRALD